MAILNPNSSVAPTRLNFANRLKDLREQAGFTHRDLAASVRLSQSYLEKIERGYSPPPSASTIRALARVLRVDADELFALSGKLPPEIERDLLCFPLLVQIVRVVNQWDHLRQQAFLRDQGVPEEKLHLQTSVEWWDIDDERQCLRELITAEIKKAVFIKDHYECVYCSARAILEVDHIYPVSLGGTSEMENLITACNRCNGRKKDRATPFPMVFDRFREAIEKGHRER